MLLDRRGSRKYLNHDERRAFARAAEDSPLAERAFGLTLLYTGCRISEALQLPRGRADPDEGVLIFETLKRRRKGVYRAVPVPALLLDLLAKLNAAEPQDRFWNWARSTASLRVADLMREAGVQGARASAKGLRHGFAIACVEANIPLTTLQKWLGHARLETTAIYADASGKEERRLAERLWALRE